MTSKKLRKVGQEFFNVIFIFYCCDSYLGIVVSLEKSHPPPLRVGPGGDLNSRPTVLCSRQQRHYRYQLSYASL